MKINISWDMADLVPYMVSTQFQESTFRSISRPKIPAYICSRYRDCKIGKIIKSSVVFIYLLPKLEKRGGEWWGVGGGKL